VDVFLQGLRLTWFEREAMVSGRWGRH
jgi:hypothetical protein